MVSQHTAKFRREAVHVALMSELNRKQVAALTLALVFNAVPLDTIGASSAAGADSTERP